MALCNLTNWDDPIFLKKSRDVEKFDERLWALLDDISVLRRKPHDMPLLFW